MKKRIILVLVSLVAFSAFAESLPADKDARMGWWRNARFGMFIHWGLYAVPAGTYHGESVEGYSEWIMAYADIPIPEYETYATAFNPVSFDAKKWVQLIVVRFSGPSMPTSQGPGDRGGKGGGRGHLLPSGQDLSPRGGLRQGFWRWNGDFEQQAAGFWPNPGTPVRRPPYAVLLRGGCRWMA